MEFDKNNNLLYDKIQLLYYAGRCYTLQGDCSNGLSLLKTSLQIVENKMPNNLHRLVYRLYHISWNWLISGKLSNALHCINRAVEILETENNDEDYDFVRIHQTYVVELQNKFVIPSLFLHQYRFNFKLTPEGFPSDRITSEVTLLLDDLLSTFCLSV